MEDATYTRCVRSRTDEHSGNTESRQTYGTVSTLDAAAAGYWLLLSWQLCTSCGDVCSAEHNPLKRELQHIETVSIERGYFYDRYQKDISVFV